jgi:hypothetical protein
MFHWKFLVLPGLIAALLSIPRSAPAQVFINIGAAPVCPYNYFDYAAYNWVPYGYYGPEWFRRRCLYRSRRLVPWPLATSTATLITASTHITATLVQFRRVESGRSITSTETRGVMGAVTEAAEATETHR